MLVMNRRSIHHSKEYRKARSFYPSRARKVNTHVAKTTGPLHCIRGRNILVLADAENLIYSARNLDAEVSFMALGKLLQNSTRHCVLHAFFSCLPGNTDRPGYFTRRGWYAHTNDIHKVETHHGISRRANCDNFLLFKAGILISRSKADIVVIASGDGDLTDDLARATGNMGGKRKVVTLSLAGSTSRRLEAAINVHILNNIEIGWDCMHTKNHSRFSPNHYM